MESSAWNLSLIYVASQQRLESNHWGRTSQMAVLRPKYCVLVGPLDGWIQGEVSELNGERRLEYKSDLVASQQRLESNHWGRTSQITVLRPKYCVLVGPLDG